jgi:hypothetical protein
VRLSDTTAPALERVVLERMKMGVRQEVGAHVAESLHLEQWVEPMTRNMVVRLTADILAEKLPPERVERSKTVTLDFPASSWQHFKQEHSESWWLRWLVRRRPVRVQALEQTVTLVVDLEKYRTFPQCNYVFPQDLGPYVNVAVTRDRLEWT